MNADRQAPFLSYFLFFGFVLLWFGPHKKVLMTHSWLLTLGLLLVVIRDLSNAQVDQIG